MVSIMVKENYEKKEKESLHERSERHAIYVIIDAVFGLSLGLGAFSLSLNCQ
jgi:fatty acid-binding protein DegV